MIGISGATDGFFGIARVETMISFSRCLYMADAIRLAAADSSELPVGDRPSRASGATYVYGLLIRRVPTSD
jgi:hypothetical protein